MFYLNTFENRILIVAQPETLVIFISEVSIVEKLCVCVCVCQNQVSVNRSLHCKKVCSTKKDKE